MGARMHARLTSKHLWRNIKLDSWDRLYVCEDGKLKRWYISLAPTVRLFSKGEQRHTYKFEPIYRHWLWRATLPLDWDQRKRLEVVNMIKKVDELQGKGTNLNFHDPQVRIGEMHFVHPRSGRRGPSSPTPPTYYQVSQRWTERSPVEYKMSVGSFRRSFIPTLWPRKSIVHGTTDLSLELDGPDKGGVGVTFSGLLLALLAASTLTSQYFTNLSRLPLTRPFPSDVNATLYTLSLWPCSRSSRAPVATSHIWTMGSTLPAAIRAPSGEIVTHATPEPLEPSLSLMVSTLLVPSCMSQIRIVLSPEPEMMRRPSLEKSRE